MRCEDVIRDLAAPDDGQNAAALANHLDDCPACAEWSARMASWDRLWNATRPVEPAPEVWDAVWNRLEGALDRSPLPAQTPHAPLRIAPNSATDENRPNRRPAEAPTGGMPRPWQIRSVSRRQRGLVAVAVAAVVLISIGLKALNSPSRLTEPQVAQVILPGDPVTPLLARPAIATVDIDEGQLVVIRSADPRLADEASVVVVNRYEPDAGIDPFNGVVIDPWYLMFNIVESMTNPVVASLDLPGR